MLRAALQFLVALVAWLPQLIEKLREQTRADDLQRERTEKDRRNAAALKAAQDGMDRPK